MATTPRVNLSKLIRSSGKPGEMLIKSYENTEQRVDDLRIEDYRRMLNNDGQIQMLYNAVVNTILSAGLDIAEDESWDQDEDSEERTFIESCLFSPYWKGGMTISIEDTCRNMLRAFVEGYRIFEVIYKVGEDNKIRLDKLAPRSGTSDAEMKIIVDENGNFAGFKQNINFAGKRIDVEVKNEGEIVKVVKATFGEEFGSLYGRSGLKASWYHYDKVHKAMFLNHVGHEFGAIKFRYVKTKHNMPEDEVTRIIDELSKVHQQSVFVAPENKLELLFESLSDPGVMAVGKDMIDLHYSLIAKSMMAQFIDLGSSISETGSRALGESQTAFFKEGLQNIATILIENTWNKVISTLIKLNFNRDIYPTLIVNPIQDKSSEFLYEALLKMVDKGTITDSVKTELLKMSTDKVGMNLDYDTLVDEIDQKNQQAEELKKAIAEKPVVQPAKEEKEEVKLQEIGDLRPLYPDEQKVRVIDIKVRLQNAEDEAKVILKRKLDKQKEDIIEEYIKALREGRSTIRRTSIQLQESDEASYSEGLLLMLIQMLEYGKILAANELNKAIPNTTKADRQALKDKVDMAIEEQTARLKFRLQSVANDALLKKLPENDARLMLEQEFDSFFNTVLFPTISILLPTAFNMGRGITLDKYSEDIFSYRYTAILDSAVCDYCAKLDGSIYQKTDPSYALLNPPNHYGCRCWWTPITIDEQAKNNFRVTGTPAGIVPYSSANSFRSGIENKMIMGEKSKNIIELDNLLKSIEITNI